MLADPQKALNNFCKLLEVSEEVSFDDIGKFFSFDIVVLKKIFLLWAKEYGFTFRKDAIVFEQNIKEGFWTFLMHMGTLEEAVDWTFGMVMEVEDFSVGADILALLTEMYPISIERQYKLCDFLFYKFENRKESFLDAFNQLLNLFISTGICWLRSEPNHFFEYVTWLLNQNIFGISKVNELLLKVALLFCKGKYEVGFGQTEFGWGDRDFREKVENFFSQLEDRFGDRDASGWEQLGRLYFREFEKFYYNYSHMVAEDIGEEEAAWESELDASFPCLEDTIDCLEKAKKIDPSNAEYSGWLGELHLKYSELIDEKYEMFETGYEDREEETEREIKEERAIAKKNLEEAIESDSENEKYLVILAEIEKDKDKVLRLLERAVHLNEENFDAQSRLGHEYASRGQVDQAIATFQYLADNFPEEQGPWFQLAKLYFKSGNAKKAQEYCERGLKKDSTNATFAKLCSRIHQGLSIDNTPSYDESITRRENAFRNYAGDKNALFNNLYELGNLIIDQAENLGNSAKRESSIKSLFSDIERFWHTIDHSDIDWDKLLFRQKNKIDAVEQNWTTFASEWRDGNKNLKFYLLFKYDAKKGAEIFLETIEDLLRVDPARNIEVTTLQNRYKIVVDRMAHNEIKADHQEIKDITKQTEKFVEEGTGEQKSRNALPILLVVPIEELKEKTWREKLRELTKNTAKYYCLCPRCKKSASISLKWDKNWFEKFKKYVSIATGVLGIVSVFLVPLQAFAQGNKDWAKNLPEGVGEVTGKILSAAKELKDENISAGGFADKVQAIKSQGTEGLEQVLNDYRQELLDTLGSQKIDFQKIIMSALKKGDPQHKWKHSRTGFFVHQKCK